MFTGTNTFEGAESKSEKFLLLRPAVFSQTAILCSLISRIIESLIESFRVICNLMRVGRKQRSYLVCNFEKAQITLSKILISSNISTKSKGR